MIHKSTSLKYEPSSEPLHISAHLLLLGILGVPLVGDLLAKLSLISLSLSPTRGECVRVRVGERARERQTLSVKHRYRESERERQSARARDR